MATSKITIADKITGNSLAATEFNSIKTVVNANAAILDSHSLALNGIPVGKTVYDEFALKGSGGSTSLGESSNTAYRGDRGKLAYDFSQTWSNLSNLLGGKQSTLQSGINIKTINDIPILGSGNINISGGGNSDFTNIAAGSAARTLTSRLSQELWVEDFRSQGDSDVITFKKAITAMQILKQPLYVGNKEYIFTETIIVGGGYFKLIGELGDLDSGGATIKGNIAGKGKFNGTVTPDLSYPTTSNPGPLNGAAFYFTSTIYYPLIENIRFVDFRFALAYLTAHNSPTFKAVNFFFCNVGVICYQGCQNYNYINCNSAMLCVLHISSSTAFPSDSPYKNDDNYYTDSLSIKNESGYGALGGTVINEFFDNWFVASILRPSVDSIGVNNNTSKYTNNQGVVYADSDILCRPSGRQIYAAFRNGRIAFSWHLHSPDVRGIVPRGILLCNTSIAGWNYTGAPTYEGVFAGGDTISAYFTVGAIIDFSTTIPYRPVQAIGNLNPIFAFTKRGESEGTAEASNKYINNLSTKLNPTRIEPNFTTILLFDDSKIYNGVLYNKVTLDIPTNNGHIVGNKITFQLGNAGGSLAFTPNKFKLIQGILDYTKDMIVEIEWNGTHGLVKIFSVQSI